MKTNGRKRKGVVLIWLAIFTILLVALLGFGIDAGYVFTVAHQLHNAADAAALAGARQVLFNQTQARQAAVNVALANKAAGDPVQLKFNGGNSSNGDVVLGVYNLQSKTFTPTTNSPNAVKVVTRRTSDSLGGQVGIFFGQMIGVSKVDISRYAIAIATSVGKAGFIVLSPDAQNALSVSGNANITVTEGGIVVNSSNCSAVRMNGNVDLSADYINMLGNYNFTGNIDFDGDVNTGVAAMADPYVDLPAPPQGTNRGTINLTGNQAITLNPGYYPGGINISGSSRVTLNPGIYTIGGAGFAVTGNSQITGNGVMLYMANGPLNITGNYHINFTPPSSGTYEGISFFQARNNTSTANFSGNSCPYGTEIGGVIYVPSGKLKFTGNAHAFGSQVVVNTLEITGNSNLTVDSTDTALTATVYLVE